MPLALASAVLLTLASLAQSAAPAPDLRNLRWVRATVSASTPDTLTVKLRDRELVVQRDATTEIAAADPVAALATGAIVEVHYAERKGVRRAIAIFGDGGSGDVSNRARTSLRGTVVRVKGGSVSVRSGDKIRSLQLEKSSRLLDRDGRTLGRGRDEIGRLLTADTELMVKYEGSSFVLDGVDLGGDDTAVEIRRLR